MGLTELETVVKGASGWVPDGPGFFDLDGVCGIVPAGGGACLLFWRGAQVVVKGTAEELRALVPDGERRLDALSDMVLDVMNRVVALEEAGGAATTSPGLSLPPAPAGCPGAGMCEGAPVFRGRLGVSA